MFGRKSDSYCTQNAATARSGRRHLKHTPARTSPSLVVKIHDMNCSAMSWLNLGVAFD
jgi:hypothetical protein